MFILLCQTRLNLKTHTVSETENRTSCLGGGGGGGTRRAWGGSLGWRGHPKALRWRGGPRLHESFGWRSLCPEVMIVQQKQTLGSRPWDVLEERRHSPFQVLDASAIEGIRGLAGESSSIHSCIQICKALTPPCPPYWKRGGRGGLAGPPPPPPMVPPAEWYQKNFWRLLKSSCAEGAEAQL